MSLNTPLFKSSLSRLCLVLYCLTATVGAFMGGAWASFGLGLVIILFLAVVYVDRRVPCPSRALSLFAILALALFAAELPLSLDIAVSSKVWAQLVSVFVPLLFLTSPRLQKISLRRSFAPLVALAAALGALALGCELLSGGFLLHALKTPRASLTEYNRGIAHLVILAFPLLAGLWISGRKQAALALAIILIFPSSLTESRTAKLALVVGLGCVAAGFYFPRGTRGFLALGAFVILGWPLYAREFFSRFFSLVEKLPPSWRHRVEIWDYLSYRITERPLFGWGLGTTHLLDYAHPHGALYRFAVEGAPHAHNFVTELWVETGILGIAIGFIFLLLTLRAASTLHNSLRPFALGCWAAAVTVSMFGFDFWTDALWAAFALAGFIFAVLQQQIERDQNIVHT